MVAARIASTMAQRPPQARHNTSCRGCDSRAETADMFGHNKCSVHRPCIGPLYWEPLLCDVCKKFRGQLRSMSSPEARAVQLHRIKTMLMRCKIKRKEAFPNQVWDFEPFYSHTFSEFLQTPSETVQQPQVGAAA